MNGSDHEAYALRMGLIARIQHIVPDSALPILDKQVNEAIREHGERQYDHMRGFEELAALLIDNGIDPMSLQAAQDSFDSDK